LLIYYNRKYRLCQHLFYQKDTFLKKLFKILLIFAFAYDIIAKSAKKEQFTGL